MSMRPATSAGFRGVEFPAWNRTQPTFDWATDSVTMDDAIARHDRRPTPRWRSPAQLERIRRILIVTDAWHPQVNGVVRTMERVAENLPALGAEAVFLTPAGFRSVPMPTYPDIRLALTTPGQIRRRIAAADADHVHIVTEGPAWADRAPRLPEEAPARSRPATTRATPNI